MLDAVIQIAREAGALIMGHYGRATAALKSDQSPVTVADLVAHRHITDSLCKLSGLPVLSEEHPIAYVERKDWDRFWLVDPLDGTKDFLAGYHEFTVNIALIRHAEPTLGVIYAPAIDELYYATAGGGSFLLKDSTRTRLGAPAAGTPIMAISRFHDVKAVQQFAELNDIQHTEAIGSSLKFCRLAAGAISIYPRFTGSCEWDIAAGHLIVKEAGGHMVDLVTLADPAYNKPSVRNHMFLAYADGYAFESMRLPADLPVTSLQ